MTHPESDYLKLRAGEVTKVRPSNAFQQGEVVGGRYRVISQIGQGGMGLVYRVNQILLNKEFALKTIDKSCTSEIAVRRFQQEARATFSIDHPNIIAVNDFGVLDDQTPFLVMELLNGETLGERLKRTGCMTLEEAIPVFVQVCFGLAYAHELGIVHRDIKPTNIMVLKGVPPGVEGSVKILDFGIAKFTEHEGGEMQALTRTGEIFGSPTYMSPEQCAGLHVDQRADIYSLGCVFFEALTGAPPFVGETALATMMKHQTESALTLKQASLGGAFPQAIEDIVATMLAKSADNRYQNLGMVAHDLGAMKRGDSISPTAKASHTKVKTISMPVSKFYGWCLGGAALSTIIGGVAGFYVGHTHSSTVATPPTEMPASAAHTVSPDKTTATHSRSIIIGQDGKKSIAFQFPQDEAAGLFKIATTDGLVTKKAAGTVNGGPPGVTVDFTPSESFLQNPRNLELFEPNDLQGLHLYKLIPDQLCSQILQQVGRLTGLLALDIGQNSGINNDALLEIEKLQNLDGCLSVCNTNIDGVALAKWKGLRKVKLLHFGNCKNCSAVLNALKDSNQMKMLYLDNDKLTVADFKAIVSIAGLQVLSVSGTQMNNDELALVGSRTKLEQLIAKDCPITKDAIPTIRKMVQNGLKNLSLSDAGFSQTDIDEIKTFLPSVDFKSPRFRKGLEESVRHDFGKFGDAHF